VVKWYGYSNKDNSWESPQESFQAVIDEYEASHVKQPEPEQSGHKTEAPKVTSVAEPAMSKIVECRGRPPRKAATMKRPTTPTKTTKKPLSSKTPRMSLSKQLALAAAEGAASANTRQVIFGPFSWKLCCVQFQLKHWTLYLIYPMDAMVPGPNFIDIIGDHIEVDLGDGFNVLFDLENMEKVTRHKWTPIHNGNHCPYGCHDHIYPCTEKTGRGLQTHNLVMNFMPNNGMTIDHINKNSLDNRNANLQIAIKAIQSINHNLQKNSTTGCAGVSLYTKDTCTYTANWYENGKKVRQYFSVIRYGEEQAKKLAIEAQLSAERCILVYAEALYNHKALVQKLKEETGETEWDAAMMPELLMFLIEEGVDVEQFRY
jgi:hypothetical protein